MTKRKSGRHIVYEKASSCDRPLPDQIINKMIRLWKRSDFSVEKSLNFTSAPLQETSLMTAI